MRVVNLYSIFNQKALVTREATSVLKDDVFVATRDGELLAFDLSEIQAMTPSFLDQLLLMVEDSLPSGAEQVKILMVNSPPGFRNRMESIGRYHRLKVVSDGQGDWLVPDSSLN